MIKFNRNMFWGTMLLGVLLLSISCILMFKRDVIGFSLFSSSNDCTPYNVFIERGENEYSLNIYWSTEGECVSFVQFGLNSNNLESIATDSIPKGREHSTTLEKLVTTQRYYYLINSGGDAYGNNGIPLDFVLNNL